MSGACEDLIDEWLAIMRLADDVTSACITLKWQLRAKAGWSLGRCFASIVSRTT